MPSGFVSCYVFRLKCLLLLSRSDLPEDSLYIYQELYSLKLNLY